MRKRGSLLIITFMAVLLIVGCKQAEEEKEPFFAVNVAKVEKDRLDDYLELNGDISTQNEVGVYPDTNGKIILYSVKVGDDVKKGQVIAYIDPNRPGMNFARNPVLSPITGTVTSIPMKSGQTVSVQTPIARVGLLDKIEIITYIPEKNISRVKLGQEAFITVDAVPNKSFRAFVSEVSPVVDPVTRMLEIKLNVRDPKQELKPGMFGDIKIITEKKSDILVVPTHAVIIRGDSKFAFSINSIPPYIKNVELDRRLIGEKSKLNTPEIEFLKSVYEIEIPQIIDAFKFEKVILPGIAIAEKSKSKEDKLSKDELKERNELFKSFYLKNKKKGLYKLVEGVTEEDTKKIWDALVDIKYTYKIFVKEELSKEEESRLYNILLKHYYLPEKVSNLELENELLDKLADDKEMVLKAYSRMLPATINSKDFKGKVLKKAADNEVVKKALNDNYLFDNDEKLYRLQSNFSENDLLRMWNYLIRIEYSFDINLNENITQDEKGELFSLLNSIDFIHFKFADRRELETGIEIDDKVEVLSGFSEGEEIVTYGQSLLDDNVRVRIISTEVKEDKEEEK